MLTVSYPRYIYLFTPRGVEFGISALKTHGHFQKPRKQRPWLNALNCKADAPITNELPINGYRALCSGSKCFPSRSRDLVPTESVSAELGRRAFRGYQELELNGISGGQGRW